MANESPRIELTAADRQAVSALLDWSQRTLGTQRQRQVIVSQQATRVTVTLRFGELYTFTVTRATLMEAATAALWAANRELS